MKPIQSIASRYEKKKSIKRASIPLFSIKKIDLERFFLFTSRLNENASVRH